MVKMFIAFFDAPIKEQIISTLEKYQVQCVPMSATAQIASRLWEQPEILLVNFTKPEFAEKLAKFRQTAPKMRVIAVAPADNLTIANVDEILTAPLNLQNLLAAVIKVLQTLKAESAAADIAADAENDEKNSAGGGTKASAEQAEKLNSLPENLRVRVEQLTENARMLGDVAEIFGGIIARENSRRMAPPTPEWQEVLTESAIAPFTITGAREYYRFHRDKVNRIPPANEYDVPEKVLVHRVMSPLTAALDDTRLPYSNDLYAIITVSGLEPGYVACVLNSRYARFYFERFRFSRGGDRGVYFSKTDLEMLPIIIPKPKVQNELVKIARGISRLPFGGKEDGMQLARAKLLAEMNRQIFKIFGFTDPEIKQLATLLY